MKKWVYKIYARIGRKKYLIWQYSNHFYETKLNKKDKKRLSKIGVSSVAEAIGLEHSQTAIQWILGIKNDIKKGDRKDRVINGKFNPHFRINTPDVWLPIEDIKEIYFEMHLYDVKEKEETNE